VSVAVPGARVAGRDGAAWHADAVPTRTAAELTAHVHRSFPGREGDNGGGGDDGGGDGALVVEAVDDESIRIVMRADTRHLRPGATVSGPTLFTLVDTVAWLLTLARLEPDRDAVTASVSMHFLRRPPAGTLVGEGRLLKLGRRTSVVDVLVHAEGASGPVVQATVTYAPV
jgi:uncharacterized protein (TIGR00369 family)